MVTIDHIALCFSSREHADAVLSLCLGMKKLKEFSIDAEISMAFFDIDEPLQICVYGDEFRLFEAFIIGDGELVPPPTHCCLNVDDLETVLRNARELDIDIRTAWIRDHDVYFLKDFDSNLYEIKQL